MRVVRTLGAPDVGLDRTAGLHWPWRRLAHLLVAAGVVIGLFALTLATEVRFGPAGLIVRDVAGLVGLAALGTAVTSANRPWFLPLGWTLPAVVCMDLGPSEATIMHVLTWQVQEPQDRPATVTAAVLALAGAAAYTLLGPARRGDAESAR